VNEQYNPEDFSQPISDLASIALDGLHRCFNNVDTGIADGVFSYSTSENLLTGKPTIEGVTTYKSVILEEIHTDLIKSEAVPDYILDTCVALSNALVDYVNDKFSARGNNVTYPPNVDWLKNNIREIWFTLPRGNQMVPDQYTAELMGIDKGRRISLNLTADSTRNCWLLEYINVTHIVIPSRMYSDGEVTIQTPWLQRLLKCIL
jgi:hypothetical protein